MRLSKSSERGQDRMQSPSQASMDGKETTRTLPSDGPSRRRNSAHDNGEKKDAAQVEDSDEHELRALIAKYPDKLQRLHGVPLARLRAELTAQQKSAIARELSNLKDQSALHRLLHEPPAWLAALDRGVRDVYYSAWLAQLFDAVRQLMLKRLVEKVESEVRGGDENQPPPPSSNRSRPTKRLRPASQ